MSDLYEKLQMVHYIPGTFKILQDVTEPEAILNIIAAALTTGHGDSYVAAFDQSPSNFQLVLAKNGTVEDKDKEAASLLITIITSPTNFMDGHHFILSRCRLRINRYIDKLHQSIISLKSHLPNLLSSYSATQLSTELPGFESIREKLHLTIDEDFATIFRTLVNFVESQAAVQIPENGDDLEDIYNSFATLADASTVLCRSRFITQHVSRLDEQMIETRKLLSRNSKIWHYRGLKDIRLLPLNGKSLHQWIGNSFSVIWVNDNPTSLILSAPSAQLAPCGYMNVIKECLPPNRTFTDEGLSQGIEKQMPALCTTWNEDLSFQRRLHPEILVVLYFHGRPDQSSEWQIIGCTERLCRFCTYWIKFYNEECGATWSHSRLGGKASVDWAIPSPTSTFPNLECQLVDAELRSFISTYLRQELDQLLQQYFEKPPLISAPEGWN